MKRFTIIICAVILLLSSPTPSFARSGCCSHHGGVSGCGCADGTPLSSTCAPYYPQCSSGGSTEVETPITYTPIAKPTYAPIPTATPKPTATPTPKPKKKTTQKKKVKKKTNKTTKHKLHKNFFQSVFRL